MIVLCSSFRVTFTLIWAAHFLLTHLFTRSWRVPISIVQFCYSLTHSLTLSLSLSLTLSITHTHSLYTADLSIATELKISEAVTKESNSTSRPTTHSRTHSLARYTTNNYQHKKKVNSSFVTLKSPPRNSNHSTEFTYVLSNSTRDSPSAALPAVLTRPANKVPLPAIKTSKIIW